VFCLGSGFLQNKEAGQSRLSLQASEPQTQVGVCMCVCV